MEIAAVIEALPGLELEEVQALSQAAYSECLSRMAVRRETCEHPAEHRGKLAIERPPNIVDGCGYCITQVAASVEVSDEVPDVG